MARDEAVLRCLKMRTITPNLYASPEYNRLRRVFLAACDLCIEAGKTMSCDDYLVAQELRRESADNLHRLIENFSA